MLKYIIFDVDGTINQTKLYALPAYKQALHKRNKFFTDDEITSCIGMKPEDILERMLGDVSEEEVRIWRTEIEEVEANLMEKNAQAFPDMKQTLYKLRAEGYHTAICSNAYPKHISTVLKAIDLEDCFDVIASLEMGNNKEQVLKNLLNMIQCDKACMVGDRKFDLDAARKNQIPIIGCLYGYAPEEIRQADRVVSNPSEIIQMVKDLIG